MYYLQNRYYDPEIGRFINADAFVSTGQGLLGNNMFAYCNNNPVNYVDPSGHLARFHYLMDYEGCSTPDNNALKSILNFFDFLGSIDVAISRGYYGSLNIGAFNLTGSIEFAADTELNFQLNTSVSFDITTAGSFSASVGNTVSVFFVPDISSLQGDTYYLGGSATVPIPYSPVAATGSANVGKTADGYLGFTFTYGVAPVSAAGVEFHGGYTYTHGLLPQLNLLRPAIR